MLFSYLRYRQTKTSSGNIDIVQLRLDRLVVTQLLTLRHPCFGLDPYFGERLGQIEQLG